MLTLMENIESTGIEATSKFDFLAPKNRNYLSDLLKRGAKLYVEEHWLVKIFKVKDLENRGA